MANQPRLPSACGSGPSMILQDTTRALLEANMNEDEASVTNHGQSLLTSLTSSHMTNDMIDDWLMGEGLDCLKLCLKRLLGGDSDWSLNVIQRSLQCSNMHRIFSNTDGDEKFMLLEVIQHTIVQDSEVESQTIHGDVIKDMNKDFKHLSSTLVQQSPPLKSTVDILVMSNELEVLCQLSTNELCSHLLSSDQDLVRTSIDCLRYIHTCSKSNGNIFTSQLRLADLDKNRSPDSTGGGMKRDLIRLIGNLCHKHRTNQNLVREMDGIPLILDTTQIDSTNPFITQWSVLAIRNLCENNELNQNVVSGIKTQGIANQVEILTEFGVDAEIVGDKVIVKNNTKHSDDKR